ATSSALPTVAEWEEISLAKAHLMASRLTIPRNLEKIATFQPLGAILSPKIVVYIISDDCS
ncbi:MAG: hypothetical protein KJ985_03850, partial [Proteobacteria bacterium]|nr:hypothetical protein [Pseudomonadota bacterium]